MNNRHANSTPKRSPDSATDSFDTRLNGWAANARSHQAPPGLATRIIARAAVAQTDPIELALGWLRAALWRPIAFGSLPFALGFLFAVSVPVSTENDRALTESLQALAFTEWSIDRVGADATADDPESPP